MDKRRREGGGKRGGNIHWTAGSGKWVRQIRKMSGNMKRTEKWVAKQTRDGYRYKNKITHDLGSRKSATGKKEIKTESQQGHERETESKAERKEREIGMEIYNTRLGLRETGIRARKAKKKQANKAQRNGRDGQERVRRRWKNRRCTRLCKTGNWVRKGGRVRKRGTGKAR